MKKSIKILLSAFMLFVCSVSHAQVDKKEVRSGNRSYSKGDWKEAEIAYRKALVKDSTSFAGNYNLGSALYRQKNYDEAGKTLDKIKEAAAASPRGADYFFNAGDVAVAKKDWQGAVDAFKESLILNPGDLDAKENYIYAKKMLDNEKNGGGGGGQDQQNQNDNQDDQNKDNQNDQNQNQNQDQNQNNDQNGQNQNNPNDSGAGESPQSQPQSQQDSKISPQQAQQMLRAIQAKEKDTQDKVNKEKAAALKSRQKDKNW